jgi:hypothetical protein
MFEVPRSLTLLGCSWCSQSSRFILVVVGSVLTWAAQIEIGCILTVAAAVPRSRHSYISVGHQNRPPTFWVGVRWRTPFLLLLIFANLMQEYTVPCCDVLR